MIANASADSCSSTVVSPPYLAGTTLPENGLAPKKCGVTAIPMPGTTVSAAPTRCYEIGVAQIAPRHLLPCLIRRSPAGGVAVHESFGEHSTRRVQVPARIEQPADLHPTRRLGIGQQQVVALDDDHPLVTHDHAAVGRLVDRAIEQRPRHRRADQCFPQQPQIRDEPGRVEGIRLTLARQGVPRPQRLILRW